MKTLLPFLSFLLISFSLAAQTVSSQDEKVINDYLKKTLFQEITVVAPEAVSKVFSGKFFVVSPKFDFPNVEGFCEAYSFNVNAGVVVLYEQFDTDRELPKLLLIVKNGFLLKDETAAILFEAALNTLYPVAENEKAEVKHMKKGNQWIFLRKKFFGGHTVVIATIGANGVITKLEVKRGYQGA